MRGRWDESQCRLALAISHHLISIYRTWFNISILLSKFYQQKWCPTTNCQMNADFYWSIVHQGGAVDKCTILFTMTNMISIKCSKITNNWISNQIIDDKKIVILNLITIKSNQFGGQLTDDYHFDNPFVIFYKKIYSIRL